jgi:hypothetical protein
MELEKLKYPIGDFKKPETISDVDIINWIKQIEEFPGKINELTSNLTTEELHFNYRLNGWNIKQVVHHCADSHINAFIRIKLALTENTPTIKPYQEALWANLPDGNTNSISDSLLLIKGLHARWTTLLKSLKPEDFEKEYYHPENNRNYKLNDAIAIYAWHCNHHLAHIKNALLFKNQF